MGPDEPERGGPAPRPPRRLAQRILAAPLAGAVALYTLLDEILSPLLRPLIARLARLRLFEQLRLRLLALGPWQALAILAVPFLLLEPLKLVALYWAAVGHPGQGLTLLGALHLMSILSTERLFSVVKPRLLTLPWFARLWSVVTAVQAVVLRLLHSLGLMGLVQLAAAAGRRLVLLLKGGWRSAG
jgi:hypothetical protein